MNASELTFGIEIETTISPERAAALGLRIGSYYSCGEQVPYLPAGWVAKRDGSIHGENGRIGCEIVSPILKGAEGLAQVILVARTLEEKGHRVNASCGVHVHVGFSRYAPAEVLARLISAVAYAEKGIYAITGTKNRERGTYCGGIRKYGDDKAAKVNLDINRYHVLNLTNLASGSKDTVEFRAFSGSLNPVKLVGWVQVCLGLVEHAVNNSRKSPWNPKRTQVKRGQEGLHEANYLMWFLGWTDDRRNLRGWIMDDSTRVEVIAEFRRLAKKYDEMI